MAGSVIRSYRDLNVWSLAMDLVQSVYELTKRFPKQEEYRLTSQILRAAVTVPANIAEGHTRSTRKDYAHFVSIARGSIAELETLLLIAERIGCAPAEEIRRCLGAVERVGKMLSALRQSLSRVPST
jgi:four helix bundle protein